MRVQDVHVSVLYVLEHIIYLYVYHVYFTLLLYCLFYFFFVEGTITSGWQQRQAEVGQTDIKSTAGL